MGRGFGSQGEAGMIADLVIFLAGLILGLLWWPAFRREGRP